MTVRQAMTALITLGLALPLAGATFGEGVDGADRMRPSAADRQFMDKAAEGGIAEVALGQLAERKGQSDAVQQFGHRMSVDHSKANDELKALADREGVGLPKHMSRKDQRSYNRLSRLSPDRFDKAYSRDMVLDHQTDIREFEREARSGHAPEVKAWAEKTLPTLREHLHMARGLKQTNPRSARAR